MSDQASLHATRQRIGSNRQPSHGADLQELHKLIVSLGLGHPYELEYDQRIELEKRPAYARGGRGPRATILNTPYLYRITGAKTLACSVSTLKLGGISKLDNDEIIWNAFNDLSDANRWRPLSRYAQGMLTGRRDITWWTGVPIQSDNLVVRAHQMGMYELWIPIYALLLRCPTSSLPPQQVPTVLDAFDQEVFQPMRYADNPPSGITINLERTGTLKKGLEEFVLDPFPVDAIEVLPVLVNGAMRAGLNAVERGPDAWALLEEYLQAR